jgi:hypothetical protein
MGRIYFMRERRVLFAEAKSSEGSSRLRAIDQRAFNISMRVRNGNKVV